MPREESSAIYTFTVVSNGNSDSKDLSLTIVSVEVLVNNALLKWTSCEHKSESPGSGISAKGSNVTYVYSSPSKRAVGNFRSAGYAAPSKIRNLQQIKLRTMVQGQQLTKTITLSN